MSSSSAASSTKVPVISAREATTKLKDHLVHHASNPNGCACGYYDFPSDECAHVGFRALHKCGGNISRKTRAAVFCPRRNVPVTTITEYKVSEVCKECRTLAQYQATVCNHQPNLQQHEAGQAGQAGPQDEGAITRRGGVLYLDHMGGGMHGGAERRDDAASVR